MKQPWPPPVKIGWGSFCHEDGSSTSPPVHSRSPILYSWLQLASAEKAMKSLPSWSLRTIWGPSFKGAIRISQSCSGLEIRTRAPLKVQGSAIGAM